MSDILEFNKRARVRDEASLWLTRLQEGLDAEQQQQLSSWLVADQAHEVELLDLATIWDELEVLTELAPLFDGVPTTQTPQPNIPKSTSFNTSWARLGVAASLLLSVGFGAYHVIEKSLIGDGIVASPTLNAEASKKAALEQELSGQNEAPTQYKTTIGQQLELTLTDGSVATLNTDTQIELSFSTQNRVIHLLRGEAHFDVFKDPSRPLKVLVSGKSVQAVGTAFSVRKNNDTDIEVAVDKGLVAVYQVKANSDKSNAKALKASLDAGDVFTIADEQSQLIEYNLEEMEERLAWREGMIVINDETLDYVINEFGRYSEKKIFLADKKMGETRVAGYFRLGDVDALLIALEKNFKIRSEYYQTTNTYVLSQL